MNNVKRRVPTRFAPETRFEVRAEPAVPFRVWQEDEFEHLRAKLLSQKLDELWESKVSSELRRASNEAAALAWLTPFPLLVFPELFEEKVAKAEAQARKQEHVRRVSRVLLAA